MQIPENNQVDRVIQWHPPASLYLTVHVSGLGWTRKNHNLLAEYSFGNPGCQRCELQFLSVLITVFAAGALLVAGVGLYGLVALNMARRTREFAVRIALGATSPQIWLEALQGGIVLTGGGLAAGLLASVAASRALRSVLFGVSPTDGVTYVSVVAVLAVTCVAACLVPARRATRTDPAKVLREE